MREIGRCLVGSQNYKLDGPDSDKDYKILLYPSFNDLYHSRKVEKSILKDYDYKHNTPIDCRQFNTLLLKGNINIAEMIFSTEWEFCSPGIIEYVHRAKQLFNLGYIVYVWDNFYNSAQGMALNTLKQYGTDKPKPVSRAYYIFKLVESLATQGFYMSESTWRNNFYCDEARDIRFHSEKYNLENISSEIVEAFHANKDKFANTAKEWCDRNNDAMVTLFDKANDLDKYMYYYVKHECTYLFNEGV